MIEKFKLYNFKKEASEVYYIWLLYLKISKISNFLFFLKEMMFIIFRVAHIFHHYLEIKRLNHNVFSSNEETSYSC